MRLPVSNIQHRRRWLWLIVVGLVALSGSAMALSVGVLLLVLAAFVMPMFAFTAYTSLRTARSAMTTPPDHALFVASTRFARRLPEDRGVDVCEWENEGGAWPGRREAISRQSESRCAGNRPAISEEI